MEFQNPWIVAFYAVAVVAASWHFAYGIWLFAAKWGIVTGDEARRRFGYVCLAIALLFIAVGAVTMVSFLKTPLQPLDAGAESMLIR
jgi:succinate dehydrogenase / fumarate reductase, cytochrome b subunit